MTYTFAYGIKRQGKISNNFTRKEKKMATGLRKILKGLISQHTGQGKTQRRALDYEKDPFIYNPSVNPWGKCDEHIDDTAVNMIKCCQFFDNDVVATFNGVTFRITPKIKDPEEVKKIWHEAMRAQEEAYKKTPEYLKEQEERKKQEEKNAIIQAEIDQKIAHEKLDTTGHTNAWNKLVKMNRDAYGKGVIKYAERWGKLMQVEMRLAGQTELTKEIVNKTRFIADNIGMSAASASFADGALIKNWVHGAKLGEFLGWDPEKIKNYRTDNADKNTVVQAKMRTKSQKTV